MKICDLHTHSNNSFDASDSVDKMCESAVNKGLYAIAITDHCEAPLLDISADTEFGDFTVRIPKSVLDISVAKEKYGQKLKVLCGVEIGEPTHNPNLTNRIYEYADFDFILASVHNLKGKDDFYYNDFTKEKINDILKLYFDELAETAQWDNFDSLAHLTYPLRYIVEKTGYYPDLSPYQDVIDDIYKTLISSEKALEINTSGYSKAIGCTLPDEYQIKRYKELGGKYITLGSDAHSYEALAQGIEKGIELAKKCGFTHYTIFEKRKPVLIPIE